MSKENPSPQDSVRRLREVVDSLKGKIDTDTQYELEVLALRDEASRRYREEEQRARNAGGYL